MSAIKLFYRDFGNPNNPPLLILHGLFGMSDNWAGIGKVLAKTHYVITPDLRNHGNSPHTDEFSYDLMLEDVRELLDQLKLRSIHVLGHSMGGKLAMNLAGKFPDLIDRLIVADMSPREGEMRDIHLEILNTISRTDLSKFQTFSEIESFFDVFIPKKKIVLFALKNIRRNANGSFEWKLNYFSLYQNTHRIMEPVILENPFYKPSLFIRGGESDYITNDDIAEIEHWFPNSKIETIPNASHWVHADNPALFINLVTSALNAL